MRGQGERARRVDRQARRGWPGAAGCPPTARPRHCRLGVRPGVGQAATHPGRRRRALCSRVTTTRVIARTRPGTVGSPNGSAYASRSPISAVGNARVPSLSLSRRTTTPGAGPCGAAVAPASGESTAYRGTRNGARTRLPRPAPSGRANATAIAASAAEQNHFSPLIRHDPSAAGRPSVVVRRQSEPPCDSVIHCPLVIAVSGSVEISRGSQASRTAASTSGVISSAAAPSAIATGQENVADSGPYRCSRACWTTRAAAPQRAARRRQVGQGDHGVPGGGGPLRLPAGAGVDPVDAGAPRVVADQRRRVGLGVGVRGAQRPDDVGGQRVQPPSRGGVPVLTEQPASARTAAADHRRTGRRCPAPAARGG